MSTKISFVLNGKKIHKTVEDNWTLLYLLREKLKMMGTKEGCGVGECGACTVIVDGKAVNSCIYLSVEINGKNVLTIEGLSGKDNNMDSLQKAFVENAGVQCGFCTPGMIMSSKALIEENNNPNEEDIKHALAGNICRCTGYSQIISSVLQVSAKKESSQKVFPQKIHSSNKSD